MAMTKLPITLFLPLLCVICCSCGGPATGPNVIDEDHPKEFTTTESGLQYRILRKSDGTKPAVTDTIVVDYTGWLDETQMKFDSSYDQRKPLTTPLSKVVEGWQEGLQLVGEGGMIELKIPPDLGYGEAGAPPRIPPNATLLFRVELHEVK